MVFSLVPETLDAHAVELASLADTMPALRKYGRDHLIMSWSDTAVVFAQAGTEVARVRRELDGFLANLEHALRESERELRATAARSRELDDDIERELDRAYAGSGARSGGIDEAGTRGRRTPVITSPPPVDVEESEDLLDLVTHNWLSLTADGALLIEKLSGYNPLAECSKTFAGDWNRLAEAAQALSGMATVLHESARYVRTAMAESADDWTGEAATAAGAFFAEFAGVLTDAGDDVSTLAAAIDQAATGMEALAEIVQGLMAEVIDWGISTAILAVVGLFVAPTGIGAAAAYGGAAVTSVQVVRAVKAVIETIGTADEYTSALSATVGWFAPQLNGPVKLPTPKSYDNALVDAASIVADPVYRPTRHGRFTV